jgi:hypothetical protein
MTAFDLWEIYQEWLDENGLKDTDENMKVFKEYWENLC